MAYTLETTQQSIVRGSEYQGLHFKAFEISGSWAAGEFYNTKAAGLVYAAVAAPRVVAKTAGINLGTHVKVLPADPGVIEVVDAAVTGGDLLIWYAHAEPSAASATASDVAGVGLEVTERYVDTQMSAIPVSSVGAGNVYTVHRPHNLAAIGYDSRGDTDGSAMNLIYAPISAPSQFIFSATGPTNVATPGRILYWHH